MTIRLVKKPITKDELARLASEGFGDMIKAAVDVEQEIMAVGGELHADEEAVLLEQGSRSSDVWGINVYPKKSEEEWIEFNSMINLKPALGNRSRGVDDVARQQRIKSIVRKLIVD